MLNFWQMKHLDDLVGIRLGSKSEMKARYPFREDRMLEAVIQARYLVLIPSGHKKHG